MRKLNSILGASLIVLLLIHMVTGALQLTGLMSGGAWIRSVLSFIMMTIVIVHAIIGVILTVRTIKDSKGGGERYFKQNKRFWLSRISGLAMMILILYHVLIFSGKSGDTFRLNMFGNTEHSA